MNVVEGNKQTLAAPVQTGDLVRVLIVCFRNNVGRYRSWKSVFFCQATTEVIIFTNASDLLNDQPDSVSHYKDPG